MSSALDVFSLLAEPMTGSGTLTAGVFPGHEHTRVAKSEGGLALVLVRAREEFSRSVTLPVRTEYLHVVYSAPYRVSYVSGETGEEAFTAITCLSQEPSFVRYFFSVIASLLDSIGADPTVAELTSAIRTVVQLFSALTLPPTNTIQGLWAELCLIATARDKTVVARGWHATPDDRYDFVRGPERVEVKSSGRRERRHHFSLEQLSPPASARLWIASLFVERSAGGVSLGALLEHACDSLSALDATRLRYVTAESLGAGFANALEVSFDFELARDSLRYYESTAVPLPPLPMPAEISEIRFVADLSGVQPVSMRTIDDSALLFALAETNASEVPSRT